MIAGIGAAGAHSGSLLDAALWGLIGGLIALAAIIAFFWAVGPSQMEKHAGQPSVRSNEKLFRELGGLQVDARFFNAERIIYTATEIDRWIAWVEKLRSVVSDHAPEWLGRLGSCDYGWLKDPPGPRRDRLRMEQDLVRKTACVRDMLEWIGKPHV